VNVLPLAQTVQLVLVPEHFPAAHEASQAFVVVSTAKEQSLFVFNKYPSAQVKQVAKAVAAHEAQPKPHLSQTAVDAFLT